MANISLFLSEIDTYGPLLKAIKFMHYYWSIKTTFDVI